MSPWKPLPEERDPRPVRDSLPGLAKSMGAPELSILNAVFARWEEIVGPAIAANAWPLSLRDGILRIGVEQPAWAAQLGFLGSELLRKIGAATGEAVIEKIDIKVVPRPRK